MDLKESKEGCVEGYGRRKGKGRRGEERGGENAIIIVRCPQIKDIIKQMQG